MRRRSRRVGSSLSRSRIRTSSWSKRALATDQVDPLRRRDVGGVPARMRRTHRWSASGSKIGPPRRTTDPPRGGAVRPRHCSLAVDRVTPCAHDRCHDHGPGSWIPAPRHNAPSRPAALLDSTESKSTRLPDVSPVEHSTESALMDANHRAAIVRCDGAKPGQCRTAGPFLWPFRLPHELDASLGNGRMAVGTGSTRFHATWSHAT